jgi:hypothetical protein
MKRFRRLAFYPACAVCLWMLLSASLLLGDKEAHAAPAADTPPGTWQCWGLSGPAACDSLPSSVSALYAVDMVSSTDGWAVGRSGTILHWNGSTWSQVQSPTTWDLHTVSMVSSTLGWIGGSRGTVLRWDGAQHGWTIVASPANWHVNSISATSADDAWAAVVNMVNNSTLMHWDGQAWTNVFTTPGYEVMNSVSMVSPDYGWAVGRVDSQHCSIVVWPATCPDAEESIRRWNGTSWSTVSGAYARCLLSVDTLGANEAWAVGGNPNCGTEALHWNGVSWTSLSYTWGIQMRDVDIVSPTDAWAVGSAHKLLHWDGANWTQVSRPTSEELQAIAMTSATDGWAVGYLPGGNHGFLLRYTVPPRRIYLPVVTRAAP